MTAFANKSFTVAMGLSKEGRDNWDRIFKKRPPVVDEYLKHIDELRGIRTRMERDWETREELVLEAMQVLWKQATVDEQKQIEELDHNRAFPDWRGE